MDSGQSGCENKSGCSTGIKKNRILMPLNQHNDKEHTLPVSDIFYG